jgi:hypothetical protein
MIEPPPPASELVQIVGLCLTFLGVVFSGIMTYLGLRIIQQGKAAATEAKDVVATTKEVKTTLVAATAKTDGKLDTLAGIGDESLKLNKDIHTLVNSAMGNALRLSAAQSKRIAETTGDPADIALAEQAAKLFKEHEAKQYIVDTSR